MMTMKSDTIKVPAGEFKAKCLALLDEVALTGRTLIVTKHGKPVARLSPLRETGPPSLLGSVVAEDDIVSPSGGSWSADR